MAVTHVQRAESGTAGGTDNCTVALGSSVTAGATLVCDCVGVFEAAGNGAVSDNQGGTWERLATLEPNAGDNDGRHAEQWVCVGHPGGSTTVTWVKPSGGSGNARILVREASASVVADSELLHSVDAGTGTDAVASSVMDIGGAAQALLYGLNYRGSGSPAAAGTGFTDEGSFISVFGRSERASVTGNAAVTFTSSGATFDFIVSAFALVEETGVSGSGAITLPSLEVAGAGVRQANGAGAITLPSLEVAGAGVRQANGSGAITLPAMEVAGTGVRQANGSGAITLPAMEVAGTGAFEGAVSGSGDITLPSLEVAGAGVRQANGAGAITLPDLQLSGTGERSVGAAGAIVLPEMQVSGAGARQVTGSGSLLLPAIEVAGAGEVIGQASGAGALLLPELQVTGVGYRTIVGAGAITLPELVVFGLPPGYGVEISRIQYTLKAGGVQFGLRHGTVAFDLN